jgi:hypothetical protein
MEVIKLYISQMSEIFKLSDVSIMMSSISLGQPPRFPENSHSICSAYYLHKITADIQETVNELVALDIAQDTGLKGFLESVRWRFVDYLITTWHRGWSTTIAYCGMIIIPDLHHRCQDTPLSGILGIKTKRNVYHTLSCPDRGVSATHDSCCVQDCAGERFSFRFDLS